jgi:hypothetical protein
MRLDKYMMRKRVFVTSKTIGSSIAKAHFRPIFPPFLAFLFSTLGCYNGAGASPKVVYAIDLIGLFFKLAGALLPCCGSYP